MAYNRVSLPNLHLSYPSDSVQIEAADHARAALGILQAILACAPFRCFLFRATVPVHGEVLLGFPRLIHTVPIHAALVSAH